MVSQLLNPHPAFGQMQMGKVRELIMRRGGGASYVLCMGSLVSLKASDARP